MGWVAVVGGWVDLDYNVSSGPFLSFEIEIEIGDGPGPELDNISCFILQPSGLPLTEITQDTIRISSQQHNTKHR